MAIGISPNVYTSIIDLSSYLADIPGTVGFIPILSKRGPDNSLTLVTNNEQYQQLYGQPNILDYGKSFGQGPYIATQHLSVSSDLFVLRSLPTDATYAHVVVGMQLVDEEVNGQYSSSTSPVSMPTLQLHPLYMDGLTHTWQPAQIGPTDSYKYPTVNHIKILQGLFLDPWTDSTTNLMHLDYSNGHTTNGDGPESTGGVGVPNGILMYFRTIGRGADYNSMALSITKNPNPQLWGTYILDIFDVNPTTGDQIIIESFNVSFDPTMVDSSGDSMFIEDVVNKYSQNVRCSVNDEALRELYNNNDPSYMMQYYMNDPTLPDYITQFTVLDPDGRKTQLGYKATVIEFAQLDYTFSTAALTEALNDLAAARLLPSDTPEHITKRNNAISIALIEVSNTRVQVTDTNTILQNAYNMDLFDFGQESTVPFEQGSEGSLMYADRTTGKLKINSEEAIQVLADAYSGLLVKPDDQPLVDPVTGASTWPRTQYVDEVLDLDWIYFSLVYDAGYPQDVKTAARELADTYRLDCMCVSDCGDNIDLTGVLQFIGEDPINPDVGMIWNSRYAARFEPYSLVYDNNTGKDMWVSPIYHMSQVIPLNDRLYQIWYANAGFNRGILQNIKKLRWSAKQGDRDQLYLQQVNPIVHWPQGYTIWGNLTTQKRPTALQDINCMRMVLYIKRALEQYCKYFIFEFNDQITWDQIKSGIIPFLDTIKAARGLVNFSVDVGATDTEFKAKICHVDVTLQPMKVIEKIALNLFIE